MPIPPQTLKANVADFVQAFGETEARESTTLDDASATSPNWSKIEFALEDAYLQCMSADAIACSSGKVLIRLQLRRLMLDIARYQLDVLKQRPDVAKAYDQALAQLATATSKEICELKPDKDLLIELNIVEANNPILSQSGPATWTADSLAGYLNTGFSTPGGGFNGRR